MFGKIKFFGIYGIILLVFMSCTSGQQQPTPSKPSGQEVKSAPSKEITIRNVCKETVYYTIKPVSTSGAPVQKTIAIGVIDRYPGDISLNIAFKRGTEWIRYKLDPGMPYSFRYDENSDIELYDGSHGREDAVDLAPYVPTPAIVVDKMLKMAWVNKNDTVYDLGCGDGRIVISAAQQFGAKGVGIDLDEKLIAEARQKAKLAGVAGRIEFRAEDVTKSDLSQATVVTIYLLTESNELLRPLLEEQLRSGTRVVSHNYDIPGWKEKEIDYILLKTADGEEHTIYLYRKYP